MVIDSLSVTVMDFTNDESSYMFMVILSFDALSGHPFLMMFIVLSFDGLGEMLYDTPYMGYSFFKNLLQSVCTVQITLPENPVGKIITALLFSHAT